jgi:hypothetical protein
MAAGRCSILLLISRAFVSGGGIPAPAEPVQIDNVFIRPARSVIAGTGCDAQSNSAR